jgi:hypothetical protein
VELETASVLYSESSNSMMHSDTQSQLNDDSMDIDSSSLGTCIPGTNAPIDGWFQVCRGCNIMTARTKTVRASRTVCMQIPLCARCNRSIDTKVQAGDRTVMVSLVNIEWLWLHKLEAERPGHIEKMRREWVTSSSGRGLVWGV